MVTRLNRVSTDAGTCRNDVRGVCPIVLGHDAWDLRGALNTGFDNLKKGENGAMSSPSGAYIESKRFVSERAFSRATEVLTGC